MNRDPSPTSGAERTSIRRIAAVIPQDWLLRWRPALTWGIGTALAHRAVLTVWMAAIWLTIGAGRLNLSVDSHNTPLANLPLLKTPLNQATLGVWRRWDAVLYLDLAQNGYRVTDPLPTVFGPLTPLGIHLADMILPGPVDIGGVAFGTAAFALALILLCRVCQVYYGDSGLPRRAAVLTALLPLSYYYSAPMSEGIYLALALGVVYAGASGRWWLAALSGFLATLARSQGIVLIAVAALMLAEEIHKNYATWPDRLWEFIRRGWSLALIPLAYIAFVLYRQSLALPPLAEVYPTFYVFFVNPLEGLIINLGWFVEWPLQAVKSPNLVILVLCLGLLPVAASMPRHNRLPLLAYTVGHVLIFVSKIDWVWGTREVLYTNSFARYALVLFPLVVLLADGLGRSPRWLRLVSAGVALFGLLLYSAVFALGFGPH